LTRVCEDGHRHNLWVDLLHHLWSRLLYRLVSPSTDQSYQYFFEDEPPPNIDAGSGPDQHCPSPIGPSNSQKAAEKRQGPGLKTIFVSREASEYIVARSFKFPRIDIGGPTRKFGAVSRSTSRAVRRPPAFAYVAASLIHNPCLNLASSFLRLNSKIRKNWWKVHWACSKDRNAWNAPMDFTLLHLASFLDLVCIAQQMQRQEVLSWWYPTRVCDRAWRYAHVSSLDRRRCEPKRHSRDVTGARLSQKSAGYCR
jgi:hypothetical protein